MTPRAPTQRLAVQQDEHLPRVDSLDLLAGGAGGFGTASGEHAGQIAKRLGDGLGAALLEHALRVSTSTRVFSESRNSARRDADSTLTKSTTGCGGQSDLRQDRHRELDVEIAGAKPAASAEMR